MHGKCQDDSGCLNDNLWFLITMTMAYSIFLNWMKTVPSVSKWFVRSALCTVSSLTLAIYALARVYGWNFRTILKFVKWNSKLHILLYLEDPENVDNFITISKMRSKKTKPNKRPSASSWNPLGSELLMKFCVVLFCFVWFFQSKILHSTHFICWDHRIFVEL